MADPEAQLASLFRWDRPIYWDPVPDWIIKRLDDRVLTELFIRDLDLQRTVLKEQLAALEAKAEIIQRSLG